MWTTLKDSARDWRYAVSFVGTVLGAAVVWRFAPEARWLIPLLLLGAPIGLVINMLTQRAFVRRLGGGDTANDLNVSQKRVFVLDLPYDEAFDSCVNSIKTLRRGRVGRCDRKRGTVSGRMAWSWRSFGDRIRFRLSEREDGRTQVELTSHPLYHSTLIDYGSNYDNAERLTANLGVRPGQYLLRAARAGDDEAELLRAATGAPAESANLFRPDLPDEPKRYMQADDRDHLEATLRH